MIPHKKGLNGIRRLGLLYEIDPKLSLEQKSKCGSQKNQIECNMHKPHNGKPLWEEVPITMIKQCENL
jgi:hypothetical protein